MFGQFYPGGGYPGQAGAVAGGLLAAATLTWSSAAALTHDESRFRAVAAPITWTTSARLLPLKFASAPTAIVWKTSGHLTIGSPATITIGGADVRARVRMAGVSIRDILNDAPNTCQLVVDGDRPAVGQSLRITKNGVVLFAGLIQGIDHSYTVNPNFPAWELQAIDDTAAANAKRPFGAWVDTSASLIAQSITQTYAPGFSTAGIEPGLPPISIILDGADTFIAALSRMATAIGGYSKIEDRTVYLFTSSAATAPVTPIDRAHPTFLFDPPIRVHHDLSQIRTRVYGKGYGENLAAEVAPGETMLPIANGANYTATGGRAIAGTTADGAQSEQLTYGSVELQGLGTLVGPGAAPGNAPNLTLAAGSGVTTGLHEVAVVFVTALGKSRAGPVAALTVGAHPNPATAPVANTPTTGTGPDQGSHEYVVTFLAVGGETTPGPASNAMTTSAAQGQVAAPGSFVATNTPPIPGNHKSDVATAHQITFVTPKGETDGGAVVALTPPGFPINYGSMANGQISNQAGGGMTPGWYRYWFSYTAANGYETVISGNLDVLLNAGSGSVKFDQFLPYPNYDLRMTKRRVYRSAVGQVPAEGGYFVAEMDATILIFNWTDTASDASIAGNEQRFNGQPARGPDPGYQVSLSNIPSGVSGVTARKIYRRINAAGVAKYVGTINNNTTTTFTDNVPDSTVALAPDVPSSNTTGTAVQVIPVTAIPVGPPGTTSRRLYRRFNGGGPFKLVTTLANNTQSTFTDTITNAALGVSPPASSTAVGNQIALSAVPTGGSTVTAREIYMTPAGGGALKYANLTIAGNTETTGTITAADGALGGPPPTQDTSGLDQPKGQINPGETAVPLASTGMFKTGGGWVVLAAGQVVRYTAITGQSLTGIPPSGPGAITATILYGSQALPSAMLVGVTGVTKTLKKGAAIHIWVQRDDLQAQAEHAARTGGDGIVEYLITDSRRGEASLVERVLADLALFARPIVTVAYATRDMQTKSGRNVLVDLPAYGVSATLTIQDVTIDQLDIAPGLSPRFTVQASSVRFSLEDTLRQLITAPAKVETL